MMLYLAPELVDMSTLVEQEKKELLPYGVYPIRKDMVPENGLLATARSSTAEKGKLMSGLFTRLVDQQRKPCHFFVNGTACTARMGDTVMTALLTFNGHLRLTEFTGSPRAGFCLMGACQDCWVTVDGRRARACSTPLAAGMQVVRS